MTWLLSALSETATVMPWMVLLYALEGRDAWPSALPGTWLPLAAYLAGGLWQASDRQDRPHRRIYALLAGTAAGYLLAYRALPEGMRTGLLHWNKAWLFTPVAAYLWHQGMRGAIEGIEYGRAFSRFTIQVGALLAGILCAMMAGAVSGAGVQVLLSWSVLLLFASGLTLLLLTREESLQAEQGEAGEGGVGSSATPMATALVLGLLGMTMAASYLLSPERLRSALGTVSGFVSPVADWFWSVAMLIVVRWLLLFAPLLRLMNRPRAQIEPPGGDLGAEGFEELQRWVAETGPTVDWAPYLKAALLLGFLALLAASLYRVHRRSRAAREEPEERISLGFWRSLWGDLRSLLGHLGRRAAPAVEQALAVLSPAESRDPRHLFRRLQAWGAARGRPRRKAETPSAYRRALGEALPESDRAAELVTAVYNQARYGRRPPAEAAVELARTAMEALETGTA